MTLCRPDALNAQTPHMWARLRDIGRELPGDVRVVVVRGEGRAFSAGLDLAGLAGGGLPGGSLAAFAARPDAEAHIADFQAGFTWLRRPDLISVAVVQGHAIGAGFQLALACDLRVVADDAKFTMAETSLGLVPDLTGTKRLVDLVGYAHALDICVTGRRVGAEEAVRIGLANRLAPRAALDEEAATLVDALLAPPRDAVVETKALLAGAGARTATEQEAAERAAQVRRLRDLSGLDE